MSVDDYLVPAAFLDAHTRKSFKWHEVERFKVPSGNAWLDALRIQIGDEGMPSIREAWQNYDYRGWTGGGRAYGDLMKARQGEDNG